MTKYTPEETARYLHQLDERLHKLEGGRVSSDITNTVTVTEAAVLANVSRRTLYNWIYTGKVKIAKVPSGKLRVFTDTLFEVQA